MALLTVGEIYGSDDAGDPWQKVKQQFGEIWAIAWLPNYKQLARVVTWR